MEYDASFTQRSKEGVTRGILIHVTIRKPSRFAVRWENAPKLSRGCGRASRRWIGVNLSMMERVEEWNPFDVLLERDSNRNERPDLAFAFERPRLPVVVLVQVERFRPLFPERDRQDDARAAARRLAYWRPAVVEIDTSLDVENASGIRTPAEVETLIARRNDVPAVAVDPVAGATRSRLSLG
jgi:hypothetical protein